MSGPFDAPSPEEVPLVDAPLVRVIAQARFPLVASLTRLDFIGPFQEAIRSEYPLLTQESNPQVRIIDGQLAPLSQEVLWRFSDDGGHWRVTLAAEFVALEAQRYSSRTEFFERFERVIAALAPVARPAHTTRLGVRYINRLLGEDLADIGRLVRTEVLGIAATSLGATLEHSLCQNSIRFADGAHMTARWGLVPADATTDPTAIEVLQEPSWVLDLDMFGADHVAFETEPLLASARGYADKIYRFFRWAMTDELLRRKGGTR